LLTAQLSCHLPDTQCIATPNKMRDCDSPVKGIKYHYTEQAEREENAVCQTC